MKQWFRIVSIGFVVFGVLLSLLAFAEVARLYLIFHDLHPALGAAFIIAVLALGLGVLVYLLKAIYAFPVALTPPDLGSELDEEPDESLEAYRRYLGRFTGRLAANEGLDAPLRESMRETRARLGQAAIASGREEQVAAIRSAESAVEPALRELRVRADTESRKSMRDVVLGVTLSPYHSVDLLIVVYRNISMVTRIVKIYHSRPTVVDQACILIDVFRVIALVNFLTLGKRLLESLFDRVPLAASVATEIGQGAGAGILTIAVGRATIERCERYRDWDRRLAAQNLASHSTEFLGAVRDVVVKDLLPEIRKRSKDISDRVWERILDGTIAAFESTTDAANSLFIKPITGSTKSIARFAGSHTRRSWRAVRRLGRRKV